MIFKRRYSGPGWRRSRPLRRNRRVEKRDDKKSHKRRENRFVSCGIHSSLAIRSSDYSIMRVFMSPLNSILLTWKEPSAAALRIKTVSEAGRSILLRR